MMGLHFDEVVIGRVDELGSYEFTREAVLAFARAYDPQSFHVSDEGAAKSHFGKLAASGWHTAAAWMRCYVETSQRIARERPKKDGSPAESGPSPGFTQLKWIRPVHAGDRVSYRTTVTDKRDHAGRRAWGLVETFNEGHNQRGELVFSFNGKVLVKKR
jgi:acyl dehydratase